MDEAQFRSRVQPPYGDIWNQLKAGTVVPFLGAGASFVGRPPGATWDAKNPAFLPSGGELSKILAKEISFPFDDPRDQENLTKVSSYFVDISGRRRLRERLRETLNRAYPIGTLHKFLANLPSFLTIITTNYDTLIEQAFQQAGKPYDLVVYPPDTKDFGNAVMYWQHGASAPEFPEPNMLDIDLNHTTVIYKMHGTINQSSKYDNFVVTEEDYVEFLSRMTNNSAIPSIFYEYFRERSFLFLGYSLSDWNLRVILKNLAKLLALKRNAPSTMDDEALPSWSIQYKPTELDRKLWDKRHVTIFDQTLDEFVTKMQEWIDANE